MLAQNFKTADELGLTDAEFDALDKVLRMLERGELQRPRIRGLWPVGKYENGFHMGVVRNPECGTVACIQGWAQIISGDEDMFDDYELSDVGRRKLVKLAETFMYGDCRRFDVTPPEAAIALRNYLTHGEPRWDEALA